MESEPITPSTELRDLALSRLRNEGLKTTIFRQNLINLLASVDPHALSVKEIHRMVSESGPDLATVYRNIDALSSANILKRVTGEEGKPLYMLNRSSAPMVSLTCRNCHSVQESPFSIPAEIEQAIEDLGYSDLQSSCQVIGICKDCSEPN